jgi:hypothetical protein
VIARAYLHKVQDECVEARQFNDRAVRTVDRIAVEADELIELVDRLMQRQQFLPKDSVPVAIDLGERRLLVASHAKRAHGRA